MAFRGALEFLSDESAGFRIDRLGQINLKESIAMKFADFMCESAICVDVKATDKIGVIQELVGSLVSSGQVKEEDRDSIVEAIMQP